MSVKKKCIISDSLNLEEAVVVQVAVAVAAEDQQAALLEEDREEAGLVLVQDQVLLQGQEAVDQQLQGQAALRK